MEHLYYHAEYEGSPGWLVEERIFDERYLGKCESIFTQGNGYLGLRNALEERYVGETRGLFVNGTFNRSGSNEVTELPNFPDVTATDIFINGYRFHLERGNYANYKRTMNYKTGESIRTLTWTCPTGEEVDFRFSRFVSLNRQHVICGKIEITPKKGSVEVTVESGLDARITNTGVQHFETPDSRIIDKKYLQTVVVTKESRVTGVIHLVNHTSMDGIDTEQESMPYIRNRRNIVTYHITLEEKKTFCVEKLAVIHTSRDLCYENYNDEEGVIHSKTDGLTEIKAVEKLGYAKLRVESQEAWKEFWRIHDVEIDTREVMDQISVRAAIYHLHIMNQSFDNRLGVGAKGLSGEEYKGHSFWDTEIFLMPYYLMNDPMAARNLLIYRYRILDGARKKAKRQGYAGAMYPWESAWITDEEVCADIIGVDVETGKPMRVLCGEIEVHISADIAYAVMQYFEATNDLSFMEEYGYEMLLETAYFWASRAEERDGRYEILHVIGPDEYKEEVDNDVYTNYMAAFNMKSALDSLQQMSAETYGRLQARLNLQEIKSKVQTVLDKLYLPKPGSDGIIPQNDTYLSLKEIDLSKYKSSDVVGSIHHDYSMERLKEIKASKQCDLVVLMYLQKHLFPEDVIEKNYLYYEKYTTHDSSLSKSTHAIIANDLQRKQEAYHFFTSAAQTDIGNNLKSCDNGIHSAANGGIWQSVVMGFGGVRIAEGELQIKPNLPDAWKGLKFTICFRGERIYINIIGNELEITREECRYV